MNFYLMKADLSKYLDELQLDFKNLKKQRKILKKEIQKLIDKVPEQKQVNSNDLLQKTQDEIAQIEKNIKKVRANLKNYLNESRLSNQLHLLTESSIVNETNESQMISAKTTQEEEEEEEEKDLSSASFDKLMKLIEEKNKEKKREEKSAHEKKLVNALKELSLLRDLINTLREQADSLKLELSGTKDKQNVCLKAIDAYNRHFDMENPKGRKKAKEVLEMIKFVLS